MSDTNQILAQEFEKPINKHTKAQLLVRMEKLLQYKSDDIDSVAFTRNFLDCQKLYNELEQVE